MVALKIAILTVNSYTGQSRLATADQGFDAFNYSLFATYVTQCVRGFRNFAGMNQKTKHILKEWVLPLTIIGILWVTGWYKPVISYLQQAILYTGVIKPDTTPEADELRTTGYDWQLVNNDSQPVDFASFRGKVVFLNFFATWCPPCIAETPGIQSLYEEIKDDDIVFVILSRDDEFQKTLRFMEKKGWTLPVYGAASPVPAEFATSVLPTTYIIDKNGTIVSEHRGMADYNNDKVKDFLRSLAAGE